MEQFSTFFSKVWNHEHPYEPFQQMKLQGDIIPTKVLPAGTIMFHGTTRPWKTLRQDAFFGTNLQLSCRFANDILGVFRLRRPVKLIDMSVITAQDRKQPNLDGKNAWSRLFGSKHRMGETRANAVTGTYDYDPNMPRLTEVALFLGFDGYWAYDHGGCVN